MKINHIFLIFFLSCFSVFSQENTKNISLDFQDTEIIDVLQSIENSTGFQFYYKNEWLEDILVSGSFNNSSLNEILNNILEETTLNYYVLNGAQVILTQNNMIFDKLPDDFFTVLKSQVIAEEGDLNPVFYNEEPSTNEVLRIGKESKFNSQKKFTL